ncbi:tetratricopeptide repeat protein [Actinomadura sp. DC4]|uniref:tetratricopeptide repeat protein n=1 Tax=Actinomadura sp. DC4 TaxID=3055069 RepID=UPI0025B1F345|nr:tetratricopeptide repeat protein [Actinomadura sp. DC4]MDN3354173.1 tetratricopeptide repeat protein [Actinomadura sp. DC4]
MDTDGAGHEVAAPADAGGAERGGLRHGNRILRPQGRLPWWVWVLDVISVLLVVAVGVTTNQVLNNGDWGSLAWGWLVADIALAGAAAVVTHKASVARARTDAPVGPDVSLGPDGIGGDVTERSGAGWIRARDITFNYHQAPEPPPPDALIPPESGTTTADPSTSGNAAASGRLVPQSEATGQAEPMLDREDEQDSLRTVLTRDTGGIVIVHGQPGVGKTTLVDAVLASIEHPGHRPRVHRHEAIPSIPLDVRTLTDDLTCETTPADTARLGKSSIARFEAALGRLDDEPVLIIIERAENLLHPGTRQLADLDLDEAFEILTTADRANVTLVLVSSVIPESSQASTWREDADLFRVPGLPNEYFLEYLRSHDRHHPSGLATLPAELHRPLCRALRGNPRDASVAYGILALNDSDVDAPALVRQIAAMPRKDVPQRLAEMLLDGLGQVRRRVLEALAAFGVPVGAESVAAILTGEISADLVQTGLRQLVARRIVLTTADLYYLPTSELQQILNEALDRAPSELLHRAAYELRRHRAAPVHNVDDLRIHFAELAALLRSRRFPAAYPVIESIDRFLQEWNCGHLLLEQRQAVQGQLRDSHLEMANDDQLGYLYGLRGDLRDASDAYGRALDYAEIRKDEADKTKLHVNLATMYWQRNETQQAYNYYDFARQDALENGQPVVLMGALQGLADCLRHQGKYDEAIERAKEALRIHQRLDVVSTDGSAASQAFRCNLELARWHSELGLVDDAIRYLGAAERAATGRNDEWLLGAFLDSQAELRFSSGDIDSALTLSTQAVEHALRLSDPVTLMQARTTACMAYLAREDQAAAAREIEWAYRYRRPGRSLVVLALLALAQRQRNNTRRAEALFQQLYEEATKRISTDGEDFGAWDFRGFALCGQYPQDGTLDKAIEAFQTARDLTTLPTPVLVDRMRFLLTQLDQCDQRPGRLQQVIDACGTGSAG